MKNARPHLHTHLYSRMGFTLVELLVVIGIIALLISILLPSLATARESAARVKCLSNLRQIVMAGVMHANDHSKGVYLPSFSPSDDSIAHLWGNYLTSADVGVCPSTMNVVREDVVLGGVPASASAAAGLPPLAHAQRGRGDNFPAKSWQNLYGFEVPADLHDGAANAQDDTGGHSYEPFGYMRAGDMKFPRGDVLEYGFGFSFQRGVEPGQPGYGRRENGQAEWGPAITQNRTINRQIKSLSNVTNPTEVYLIIDADKDPTSGGGEFNNWPEEGNNHGDEGLNAGFVDGHAEWQPRGNELIEMYLAGYADGAMQGSGVWKFHPLLDQRNFTTTLDTTGLEWFFSDTPRGGGRGR